jgi:hypothetical protein
LAKVDLAPHSLRNPLLNLGLSKTVEKPPNHDDKHCMSQASKQKETQKPQNQTLKTQKTPIKKRKQKKRGFAGDFSMLWWVQIPPPAPKFKSVCCGCMFLLPLE